MSLLTGAAWLSAPLRHCLVTLSRLAILPIRVMRGQCRLQVGAAAHHAARDWFCLAVHAAAAVCGQAGAVARCCGVREVCFDATRAGRQAADAAVGGGTAY